MALLSTDNKELRAQLETAQGRLVELSAELGQYMDDVSRLHTESQHKDQTNGKQPTCLR